MANNKQLSIIIPSFRDDRIVDTIASVRLFDDLDTVRVVIIDGGSGLLEPVGGGPLNDELTFTGDLFYDLTTASVAMMVLAPEPPLAL